MNLTWGHLRSLRSKNGVKFWTILNGKTNTARVLVGVKHQKVSTVTSSPDLWLRGQRSKKVKSQTTWNDKSNTVNVFILVKHQKKSMVTSSSDLRKRGQRSKRSKMVKNNAKPTLPKVKFWTILNLKQRKTWSTLPKCQKRSKNGRGQTSKSVHGDLFTWPLVKGSKVKKGQIANNVNW